MFKASSLKFIFILVLILLFSGCYKNKNYGNIQITEPNSLIFQNPKDNSLYYLHIPTKTYGSLPNENNINPENGYINWYQQTDQNYHYTTYINDYPKDGFGFHSFYDLPEKKIDTKIDGEFAHVSSDTQWLVLSDSNNNLKIKNRVNDQSSSYTIKDGKIIQFFDVINDKYLFFYRSVMNGNSETKDIARLDLKSKKIKYVNVDYFFYSPIFSPDGEHVLIVRFTNQPAQRDLDNTYELLLFNVKNNEKIIIEPLSEFHFGNPKWLNNDKFVYQKIKQTISSSSPEATIEEITCSNELLEYDINSSKKTSLYKTDDQGFYLLDVNTKNKEAYLMSPDIVVHSYTISQLNLDTKEKTQIYSLNIPLEYLTQTNLDPTKIKNIN